MVEKGIEIEIEIEIEERMKVIGDLIECTICRNGLVKPSYLPCSHMFCGPCVSTLTAKRESTCPNCRGKINRRTTRIREDVSQLILGIKGFQSLLEKNMKVEEEEEEDSGSGSESDILPATPTVVAEVVKQREPLETPKPIPIVNVKKVDNVNGMRRRMAIPVMRCSYSYWPAPVSVLPPPRLSTAALPLPPSDVWLSSPIYKPNITGSPIEAPLDLSIRNRENGNAERFQTRIMKRPVIRFEEPLDLSVRKRCRDVAEMDLDLNLDQIVVQESVPKKFKECESISIIPSLVNSVELEREPDEEEEELTVFEKGASPCPLLVDVERDHQLDERNSTIFNPAQESRNGPEDEQQQEEIECLRTEKDTCESIDVFASPLPSGFDVSLSKSGDSDFMPNQRCEKERLALAAAAAVVEINNDSKPNSETPLPIIDNSKTELPIASKLKRLIHDNVNSESEIHVPNVDHVKTKTAKDLPSEFNLNKKAQDTILIEEDVATPKAQNDELQELPKDKEKETRKNTHDLTFDSPFPSALYASFSDTDTSTQYQSQSQTSSRKENVPQKKDYVFCPSRLNRLELAKLTDLCSICGGSIVKEYTDEVTHLIIKLDKGRVPQTMKYFFAIADKKWVIVYDWVVDSVMQGEILPEAPYETSTFPDCDSGGEISRRTPSLLLSGVSFYFACPLRNSGASMDDCKKLVEKLGGTVLSTPYESNDSGVLVVGEGAQSRYLYEEWYKSKGWISITWMWVLDCLLSYAIIPFSKSHLLIKLDATKPIALPNALHDANQSTPLSAHFKPNGGLNRSAPSSILSS